ncbi:MAG: peptidase M16 [Desulfobacteraceae bacterium]|nr:peptidase M16 [Desulfobacteraceae bacterium]
MTLLEDINNPGLRPGNVLSGFRIEKRVALKETSAIYYALEHEATGAKYAHISSPDHENTFSVMFKTVPQDSTGVAHILEHTVLCGSRKYPVRDPFFSMLKRSLSTFMNAFTSSDWTMYPFSTQNKTDFYNLLDVYLDATFFPNLDALSFKQEGHRLEIESTAENNDALVYKGVVYNEMKGAMSSPDQVMNRSLLNALYPDTTYQYNSGGDPAVIPNLTHAQLKNFHQRHYHPSNSYFYSYGNLPLSDHLAFIEKKVLREFKKIDPETDVPPQPRWDTPKTVSYSYPLDRNEDPKKKYQVCLAWLTADIMAQSDVLALMVLEQVLLGNASSPMRKELMDSNLGTTLCDATGFDAENRDTFFSCGLKDVEKTSAPAISEIVFGALNRLATEGIDRKMIESALHQIEFHRKEITNTPYPYGIRQVLTFSGSWLHGVDPEKILKFDDDINRLRKKIDEGPYLEGIIQTYFLDNPHRVLFLLEPDHTLAETQAKRVSKELAAIRETLSEADLAKLKKDAVVLQKQQDETEDVSILPTLGLDEIPPTVHCVTPSEGAADSTITTYEQPTSGITYFSAAAGSGAVDARLLPLVPFFSYAFTKMGTRHRDYAQLAGDIDLYTGGIGLAANSRIRFDDSGQCLAFLSFTGKSLVRNQDKMMEIIRDLIEDCKFTDHVRLRQLLLEYRAGLESMIVHNGHRLAMSLAARNFSTANALSETWGGVHHLLRIKALTSDITDDTLGDISSDLKKIKDQLFYRDNFKMAVIGDETNLLRAVKQAETIQAGLKAGGGNGFAPPDIRFGENMPREGWGTSTAVSFVAQVFKTVRMEDQDAPVLAVISRLLRSLYLHREIREKGGAYGGFAVYNPEDGLFSFGSYRDPHIAMTLDTYDGTTDFLASGKFDEEDIKEAILQVCSEIDKPDPPGPAARKAFFRQIISLGDEARLNYKKRLLGTNRDRVVEVASTYFNSGEAQKAVAVISGEEQLKAVNEKLVKNPLTLNRI